MQRSMQAKCEFLPRRPQGAHADLQFQVQAVKQRLKQEGLTDVKEEHINFALGSQNADGSVEKAVQMLLIFQKSLEGVIKPYSPDVYMRGAINRNAVTCYIDSLLFAMFARLDSFEPIILRGFEQEPKRRLAAILRVYVNMLRQGILIHTDIVCWRAFSKRRLLTGVVD